MASESDQKWDEASGSPVHPDEQNSFAGSDQVAESNDRNSDLIRSLQASEVTEQERDVQSESETSPEEAKEIEAVLPDAGLPDDGCADVDDLGVG